MFTISIVENYTPILDYFLEKCSHFTVVYPGTERIFESDNPLMFKKDCFLKLSNITISPCEIMTDSISISGVLTLDARGIFMSSLNQKGLWNYSLFRNGIAVFSVSDFDVGFLDIPFDELDRLLSSNIISPGDIL